MMGVTYLFKLDDIGVVELLKHYQFVPHHLVDLLVLLAYHLNIAQS